MRLAMFLVLLAAPVLAKPLPPVTVSTGSFGVGCTGHVQLCDPPETLFIGSAATKTRINKIVYVASPGHCSSGRVHVSVDGVEKGKMRFVSRNEQAVLRKDMKLKAGQHRLDFRFEGKVGGCNTGYVAGWGGQIFVTARFPPA
jgi:hypothetical protein